MAMEELSRMGAEMFQQALKAGGKAPIVASIDVLTVCGAMLAAIVLPTFTWSSFRRYTQESHADMAPLLLGLAPRQWLMENVISLTYFLATSGLAIATSLGWISPLDELGAPTWLLTLHAVAALYACVVLRVLGDYVEPPSLVPRHCITEFRRPRYLAYVSDLRTRLVTLRQWWLLFGAFSALHLIARIWQHCHASATLPAGIQCMESLLHIEQAMPTFLHTTTSSATELWRFFEHTIQLLLLGSAWLIQSIASLVPEDASATSSATAIQDTLSQITSEIFGARTSLQLLLPSSYHAFTSAVRILWPLSVLCFFPVMMAAFALWDLIACSSAEFSGRTTDTQAAWMWPAGQDGECEWQTRPHLLTQSTSLEAVTSSLRESTQGVHRTYPDSAALVAALANHSGSSTEIGTPHPQHTPRLRITILTIGTRGDVEPFLALGRDLREAGHRVAICCTDEFQSQVEGAGLLFQSARTHTIAQSDWNQANMRTTADFIRGVTKPFIPGYPALVAGCYAAAQTCDVIIGTAITAGLSLNMGEALQKPVWLAKLAPDIPSVSWVAPPHKLSPIGWLNFVRSIHYWLEVAKAVADVGLVQAEQAARVSIGLSPTKPVRRVLEEMRYTPMLLGFSRTLFPKPLDYPVATFQCGFWQSSSRNDADDDHADAGREGLEHAVQSVEKDPIVARSICSAFRAFLASSVQRSDVHDNRRVQDCGVAVVGFGSMQHADGDLIGDIVDVLRDVGYRVLVLTGWKTIQARGLTHDAVGLDSPDADPALLCLQQLPHDWLFRSVATLVVHHGGAGTTGRTLACGVPSIVIPILKWADQPQWGNMVEEAGIGVMLNPPGRLPTRAEFAAAVERVRAPPPTAAAARASHSGTMMGDTANALGAIVRAERSGECARQALEACLCNLVLSPADADAIHPLNRTTATRPLSELTATQRMCVRNCIPCHLLRRLDADSLDRLASLYSAKVGEASKARNDANRIESGVSVEPHANEIVSTPVSLSTRRRRGSITPTTRDTASTRRTRSPVSVVTPASTVVLTPSPRKADAENEGYSDNRTRSRERSRKNNSERESGKSTGTVVELGARNTVRTSPRRQEASADKSVVEETDDIVSIRRTSSRIRHLLQ